MDDFVRTKLTEWGFTDWIELFQGYNKERFLRLEDQDIEKLIPNIGQRKATLKRNLKFLKKKQKTCQGAENVNAGPSTSKSSKRKSDPQGNQLPTKRRHDRNEPLSDVKIHSTVKDIMRCVYEGLKKKNQTSIQPFTDFLKAKIDELDVNKRELVGVFGRTGAGKSSLINAIIGDFNLLPTRSGKACTSVMIRVEANTKNQKYEAEIEFIPKEEWNDEVWFLSNDLQKNPENSDDEERLLAVYGKDWRNIVQQQPSEKFMDRKYLRDIPEFFNNTSKSLTGQSAKDLSAKLIQYTRSESKKEKISQWYWPLVKCVTVRVPNIPLLQHVTLVDLPGCGDRNKSRDKMWKELVGSCSTVWIVTEINRAASESEAWEILESACGLIGNGGQCQQIHFICTKSDIPDKSYVCDECTNLSAGACCIVGRNKETKEEVLEEFKKKNNINKHFSNECLEVFTVSAIEFLQGKQSKHTILQEEETEIPALQEFLKTLNDRHSETLNYMYVSEAYGFLSLMQGASRRDTADVRTNVCSQLEVNLKTQLLKITKTMKDIYKTFEDRLTEGVENSKRSCEETLQLFLNPEEGGSGFHKTLKCIVENNGVHKTKSINLNVKLSSKLTDSIDKEFKKTFPNEGKRSPFNGVISAFCLGTETLIKKYKAVELQLIFLKTEEKLMKSKLHQIIRDEKKTVYRSLTETIEEAMEDGYKKAKEYRGKGSLQNMRQTLEGHLRLSKDVMFENAKAVMLQKLKDLAVKIETTLEETLNKSIELSLKTDEHFDPVFSKDIELVNKYYKELEDRLN